ncbi:MAG: hypothetical protein ACRDY7_09520 [Acidimicrobiia bacterium]
MSSTTTPRSLPRNPGRTALGMRRVEVVFMVVAGLVAVNLLVFAGRQGGQDEGPPLPAAIERVIPAPNTVIRLQEDVGADLRDTYIGELAIDGVPIPKDQLRIVPSLGQVTFRPGDGKEIERLAEGLHNAKVFYWPQEKGDDIAVARQLGVVREYTWQFTAG